MNNNLTTEHIFNNLIHPTGINQSSLPDQQQSQQQISTESYVPQTLTQPLPVQNLQQQPQQTQQQTQPQAQVIIPQQQQSQQPQPAPSQQPPPTQQQQQNVAGFSVPQTQQQQQQQAQQQQPTTIPLQEMQLDTMASQFIQQQQQSSQQGSQQSSPAVASPVVNISDPTNLPPQVVQQQQQHVMNPVAGQTMPMAQVIHDNHIVQQQNTPATISDPTVLQATIQQQAFDEQGAATASGETESER